MILNVDLFRQPTETDCAPSCAYMLLKFFGIDVDYNNLVSSLKREKNRGIILFELANQMKRYNINIKVDFYNFFYLDESFNALSKKDQISHIEQCISEYHKQEDSQKKGKNIELRYLESIKSCIENDIHLTVKLFSLKDIEEIIKKKSPVIMNVSVAHFRKVKLKEWIGHAIIVTGFDDEYFYYNDPHWDDMKFGKHKLKKDHLIIANSQNTFPIILWATTLKNMGDI